MYIYVYKYAYIEYIIYYIRRKIQMCAESRHLSIGLQHCIGCHAAGRPFDCDLRGFSEYEQKLLCFELWRLLV